MKNTSIKSQLKSGFSLVEMLVVIAVIGVIAAIAIPSIGSINDSAKTAKDQRNAQSIASVYQAGSAAGVSWGTDLDTAVTDVVSGNKAPADGAFKGKVFNVPNVSADDIAGAKKYLKYENNQLTYNKGE